MAPVYDSEDYDDFDYVACYRAKMAFCQQNGDDIFTAKAKAMNAVYRHAYRNTLRTGKFAALSVGMVAENIMRDTKCIVELEDAGESDFR
jgi:hypothetical protein